MEIRKLVQSSNIIARDRGFWSPPPHFGTSIALIHSELSEALEAHRKKEAKETVAEELADAVIRIADLCGHMDIDLQGAIEEKAERNRNRPWKHGKEY